MERREIRNFSNVKNYNPQENQRRLYEGLIFNVSELAEQRGDEERGAQSFYIFILPHVTGLTLVRIKKNFSADEDDMQDNHDASDQLPKA
jgi:hypothetical protein